MYDIGLTHEALTATNLDASIAFYSQYARMQVVYRCPGMIWLSDRTRPFVIVLLERVKVEHPLLPVAHLGVECQDREEVDWLCDMARSAGRLIEAPADLRPPIGDRGFVRDLDGLTLEVPFRQETGLTVEETPKQRHEPTPSSIRCAPAARRGRGLKEIACGYSWSIPTSLKPSPTR